MTRFITIATAIKTGDTARVDYHPRRKCASGDIGPNLHVQLTDEIDVFGDPDAVIDLLADALTKCQVQMDAREIKEEAAA